jgi:cation:H+ antiporter
MKLGAYKMAISDIFGGNSFLPVLFFVAALISGKAVLPQANGADLYMTALGILLTCVYIAGLIFRPRRQIAGMGVDSLVVLLLYALGMAGLLAISMNG